MWLIRDAVKRLPAMALTIVLSMVLIFFATRVAPGDPIRTMLAGAQVSDPHTIEIFRARFGLDQPLPVQFFDWMRNLPTGNWGHSIVSQQSVLPLVMSSLGNSAILAVSAAIAALVVGTLIGTVSAWLENSSRRRVVRGTARTLGAAPMLLVTLPQFCLGLALVYLFAVLLPWFPANGMHSGDSHGLVDLISHSVLPVITLAATSVGVTARISRSSVADVLGEPQVLSARARGLHPILIGRYVLRNAAVLLATNAGLMLAGLISSSFLVEEVFNWPGIGQLTISAVQRRDFPVIEGATVVITVAYVLVNNAVDLVLPLIDPRLRSAETGRRRHPLGADPGALAAELSPAQQS